MPGPRKRPDLESPWLRALAPVLSELPLIRRLEIVRVGDIWAETHATHSHELLHVVSGRAEIRVRGQRFRAGAGDTFVIPEGTPHRDIRERGPEYRVLYVFFHWPEATELLRRFGGAQLVRLPTAAKSHIHQMMKELGDEYLRDDPRAMDAMRLLLLEILLALARYALPRRADGGNARSRAARQARQRLAQKIHEHLKEHYAEEIGLEALAEQHGVSPFHLSRAFSTEFGISLIAMLARIRLDRARALLEAGHSVKETAAAVGYRNGNYFAKVFRRITGLSPSQYLARAQGK